MASKKNMPAMRRVRTGATPVPMPRRTLPRAPGSATPVPMPTREPNYGKGRPVMPRKPLSPKKSKTPLITMTKPKRVSSGPLKAKRAPARRKMI